MLSIRDYVIRFYFQIASHYLGYAYAICLFGQI